MVAPKNIWTPYNFNKNEIQNAVFQNLGTAPSSPVNGQFYFDTTTTPHSLKVYIASTTSWKSYDPSWLLGQNNTWTGSNAFNGAITGNAGINLSGTGGSAVGGLFTAVGFANTGMANAATATRYVGGVASVAPTAGAWLAGDWVVSTAGAIFVCTSSGSPGTWVQIGATGTIYYQSIKENGGSALTQRANLNFVDGTYVNFTVTDSSPNTNVTADITPGTPSGVHTFGGSNAQGSGTTFALSSHVHALPAHDAAAHSAIKISDLAAPTTAVGFGSQQINGLADGVLATDAATVGQVQALINTGTNKTSARVMTSANVATLAGGAPLVVDGVTVANGDRVVVGMNQSTGSTRGIYVVTSAGSGSNGTWTRATDADISAEVKGGLSVWINEGTLYGDSRWVLTTNDPITLGTTSLTFTQDFAATSTTAGAGLTATGNVIDVVGGTGIIANANDVAVDTAVVVRKFTTATHSSSTSIAITHSLNNQFPQCVVVEVSTGQVLDCLVTYTSTSVTTFEFNTAPGANTLRFIIQG